MLTSSNPVLTSPNQLLKPIPINFTMQWKGPRIGWVRGFSHVPTWGASGSDSDMITIRILGDQFSGKSALLEAAETQFLCNGATVYDIFGANDNEMLAWLDSPWKDRIWLIHGDDVHLKFTKQPVNTVKMGDLHPNFVPNGRIYLTSRAFFRRSDDDKYFYQALFRLTARFRQRTAYKGPDGRKQVHVIAIRESDEFLESQRQGQNKAQSDVEAMFAKFHNQMVHHGFSLILDQHRDVDVAKKIRFLYTYLMMKNMGNIDIPRPWWPLRALDPDRLLRQLKPKQFAVITNKQRVGVGVNGIADWHIDRGEDLLKKHGIEVVDSFSGEQMKEEQNMGKGKGYALDDDIKMRILDLSSKGLSQVKVASELKISQPAVSKFLSKQRVGAK